MSEGFIEIDLSRLKLLKAALDDMGEKKFPLAIRRTLNDMAFDMKGYKGARGGMEKRADQGFKHKRSRTFIRAMTYAERATGYDVSKMSSGAGVIKKANKERAAEGLSRQETARDVKHGFTPLTDARSGNSARRVAPRFRHNKLNYVDLTKLRQHNIMKALILAQRVKKPVYIKSKNGNKSYIAKPIGRKVERFKNGNSRVPLKFLYRRNEGGIAKLKEKVPFVQFAGMDAFKKFDHFFIRNFDKLFNKR